LARQTEALAKVVLPVRIAHVHWRELQCTELACLPSRYIADNAWGALKMQSAGARLCSWGFRAWTLSCFKWFLTLHNLVGSGHWKNTAALYAKPIGRIRTARCAWTRLRVLADTGISRRVKMVRWSEPVTGLLDQRDSEAW